MVNHISRLNMQHTMEICNWNCAFKIEYHAFSDTNSNNCSSKKSSYKVICRKRSLPLIFTVHLIIFQITLLCGDCKKGEGKLFVVPFFPTRPFILVVYALFENEYQLVTPGGNHCCQMYIQNSRLVHSFINIKHWIWTWSTENNYILIRPAQEGKKLTKWDILLS